MIVAIPKGMASPVTVARPTLAALALVSFATMLMMIILAARRGVPACRDAMAPPKMSPKDPMYTIQVGMQTATVHANYLSRDCWLDIKLGAA